VSNTYAINLRGSTIHLKRVGLPCETLIFNRLHQHFTTRCWKGFKVWWDLSGNLSHYGYRL